MKRITVIVLAVLAFVVCSRSGRYFYDDLLYGLSFLAILASIPVFKISRCLGITFGYLMLNGLYTCFKFPSLFSQYGFTGESLFGFHSGQAVIILFLSVHTIFLLDKEIFKYLEVSLPIICLASSGMVLYNCLILGEYSKGGAMGNSSMDPSLIAPLWPLIPLILSRKIKQRKWLPIVIMIIPIIAVFLCKGSVGLGAVCISLFFIQTGQRKQMGKRILIALFAGIILFAGASIYFNGRLTDDSHRFWIYKAAYGWWIKKESVLFGSGLGSYWGLGPLSQDLYWKEKVFPNGTSHPFFTWMHSDWLQIIFESGLVGISLCLISSYHVLKRSIENKNYHVMTALISYASTMVFNMPAHWFLSLYSGAVLLRMGFMSESEFTEI